MRSCDPSDDVEDVHEIRVFDSKDVFDRLKFILIVRKIDYFKLY